MAEIWEKNKAYSFFRHYIDFCTRHSYRRLSTKGRLPREGAAYIYAPNHTGTMMDALLVLQVSHEATSFGARADVFRKPIASRFLRFCKIVPMARRNRDRPEELARNKSTMELIDKIIGHDVPFCIFSEGTHRTMHSLQPLRRGICHIAFTSAAQRPTFIVPIGIEYSDWFHYRGDATLTFGEPINVNELAKELEGLDDSSRDAHLQELLFKKISEQILYIPDDEHYEERLAEIKASVPPPPAWRRIVGSILGFPFFLAAGILSLPMWLTGELFCYFKVKDPAFCNSIRYAVKLVGTPIMFIVWAILGFALLPWWAAICMLIAFMLSYSLFYDWINLVCGR